MKYAALGAMLAALAGVGLAGTAQAAREGAAAATVKVTLSEWKLVPSVKKVPAGRVTFVVRNAGKMPHEFLILRTDKPAKALPMRGVKAIETGSKGRIRAFAAGSTKRLTLNLAPGKYVLLCNMPGHYKAGQAISFVVTAAGTATAAQTTNVSVSMFEMGFKLSETTVPRGTVVFDVRNDGKLPHDFRIRGQGTTVFGPGERETLTVRFPEPGTFTFVCTVEGHAGAGMVGKLIVR